MTNNKTISVAAINGALAISDGERIISINADSASIVADAIIAKSKEAASQIVKMCDDLRALGWRWVVTDEKRKFGHWRQEWGMTTPDAIYSEEIGRAHV